MPRLRRLRAASLKADRASLTVIAAGSSCSEVKAHPSEIADRVEIEHDRIMVTRNGQPSFVLMSPDDLESLEATLEIVRDDDLSSRSDAHENL